MTNDRMPIKDRRVPSSIFLFIVFSFSFSIGCQHIEKAVGREDVIVTVSEEGEWKRLESLLRGIFEREEPYSLERRPFFELRQVSPGDFDLYQFRKNLLLVGVFGSNPLIQELLTEEAKGEVLSKKALLFEMRDPWVEGQSLLIATGVDGDTLSSLLKNYGEYLFNFYKEEVSRRTVKRIYADGYEEEMALRFKGYYGWTLRLPEGYRIALEDSLGRFVQMIRNSPDRLITLYWEGWEGGPDQVFSLLKECIDLRDTLAERYFGGDVVLRDRVQKEEVPFQGRKALRVVGHWENEKKVMGGPFVSYCFIQEGRFYFLDLHLFAPGEKKWLYLLQLEEIAKTFEAGGVLP